MAFKIKAPFHVEGAGSTINPGKKINLTKKDSPDFAKSGVGSKLITYQQYRDSGGVPKGMESVFSGKGTLRVSKSYTGKKSSGLVEGAGQGGVPSTKAKTVTKTKPVIKTKPVVKVKKQTKKTVTKTKASGKQSKLSSTNLGKKSTPKENTLDAINKVSMKEFVPASKKTTTVKAAPKDNSRKAIRKRKKADKAAGVSKSQMRANKAKSKSEAASAKAKKSKNPSYRAQLTAKSERLAKRAERKGGSPAKKVGDTGLKTKKQPKKEMPYNNDPVKHFESFGSKATQRTAKNPYPPKSDRNRKFAQLQKNLKDSSR